MTDALQSAVAGGAVAASLSMADTDIIGSDDGKKKFPLMATITFGLTAAGVVFACLAMAIEQSTIVIVAGAICLFTSSYATFQRTRLMKMETLREVHNKVRQEVNRLQVENNELSAQNDELETQVEKVKEVEKGLSDIVTAQGSQVDTFVKSVKENQVIIDQIKENLEAKIMQDILSVVIRSDRDGDFTIDPEEINVLVLRLNNAQGIQLEEAKFRAMLEKKGYSVSAVLNVCKNMMDQNVDETDRVIHVDTTGLHASDF